MKSMEPHRRSAALTARVWSAPSIVVMFALGSACGQHSGDTAPAAMHARCAAAFAGSHLCHLAEYERASSKTTPPAAGAWLDDSTFDDATEDGGALQRSGRNTSTALSCTSWTVTTGSGLTITAAGPTDAACTTALEQACCGG